VDRLADRLGGTGGPLFKSGIVELYFVLCENIETQRTEKKQQDISKEISIHSDLFCLRKNSKNALNLTM
jgi:hypothetical protein